MICILYARSRADEKRKAEQDIRQQLLTLRKFARKQKWPIVGTFIDAQYSADNMARPGLKKLLTAGLSRQYVKAILVVGRDRLVRNLGKYIQLEKTLRLRGVEIVVVE